MPPSFPHPPAAVAPRLNVQRYGEAPFDIMRLHSEATHFGLLPVPPLQDAYLMAVKLRDMRAYRLVIDGRRMDADPMPAGAMRLMRSDADIRLTLEKPFDIFSLAIGQDALRANMDGLGRKPALRPRIAPVVDPVIVQLTGALLPALAHPETASPLFVSHVALAIVAHLALASTVTDTGKHRGRLAPWQEQRAKEILAADLRGAMSIADLAAECGLSPAYFATAFKRSTGRSPTAWLMEQRIAVARGMLAMSDTPLAAVALACGFLDQSHFTRHFSRLVGKPPGAWRRAMRQRSAADA